MSVPYEPYPAGGRPLPPLTCEPAASGHQPPLISEPSLLDEPALTSESNAVPGPAVR